MKRLLILICTFSLLTGGTISNVKAKANVSSSKDVNSMDVEVKVEADSGAYNEDSFEILVSENHDTRTVKIFDKLKQEESIVHYNKISNILTNEQGEIIGTVWVQKESGIYGPFKAHFDLNPTSVGTAIAGILAISAVVVTAGASGVGYAALKAGITTFFTVGGGSSYIERLTGLSFNGYFQYSQELNSNATKARNINRRLYTRIKKEAYKSYSFGDGGWFDTVKPYIL